MLGCVGAAAEEGDRAGGASVNAWTDMADESLRAAVNHVTVVGVEASHDPAIVVLVVDLMVVENGFKQQQWTYRRLHDAEGETTGYLSCVLGPSAVHIAIPTWGLVALALVYAGAFQLKDWKDGRTSALIGLPPWRDAMKMAWQQVPADYVCVVPW